MFKKIFAVIAFFFLFSGTVSAFEFSADMIMTHEAGKTTSKMYYKPDKSRMEMKSPEEMIVITRIDKKVVWNIMPSEKMYMEMPFSMKNKPMVDEKVEGEIERKYLGDETLDGHPTKKYLVTYKSGNKTDQVYQWFATDINFPVRTADVAGSWVQEFKNIKIVSQPDSLFEVPAGYKKFQMPGGMNFKD
jgi:outer membrane lipoprotein-sorting protein